MRRNSNIVGAKAPIKPQQALLSRDLLEAIDHRLVRQRAIRRPLLLLQARLDEVEGQREEAREEAGDGTRGQGLRAPGQAGALEALLGLGEEGELAEVERHGAHDGGRRAGPELEHAFVARDGGQGVDDGLVVLALGERLEPVGLHADEGQVGRVADHGGETARGQACRGALLEADGLATFFRPHGERLHECVEEAQAGCGVDGLAQEPRAEARVEVEDFALGNDVAGYGYGTRFGACARPFASELETDLDHVDGLDDGCGYHAGDTSVDEGEGGAHEGSVEEVGLGSNGICCCLFGHLSG